MLVSRDQTQNLPAKVVEAALQADPSAFPAVAGVDLGEQGYAVVKVNKVVSRSAPDEAAAKQARGQLAQVWAVAENSAYYALLKERYKVKVLVAQPATPGKDLGKLVAP